MRRAILSIFAAAALALAAVGPASAISYGQLDNGAHPNVGALIGQYSDGKFVTCSGTLIAPTVFLTASHCVDDGATMWVSFDPAITEPVTGGTNTIYQGTAHQNPLYNHSQGDPGDVAVITLDSPVVGITPASLPTLNALKGLTNQQLKAASFAAVGYGTVRDVKQKAWQSLFWDPQRRFAWQTVNSLEPAWLNLSMNVSTGNGGTCYGDSGGPHFLGSTVVAVTVTGDFQCKATDKDYRVDTAAARAFLSGFVALP